MPLSQHISDTPKPEPQNRRDAGREAQALEGVREEPAPEAQERGRKDRIPGAGPNGPRAD